MKQKIFVKRGSRLGKTPSASGSSLFSFRNVFKFIVIVLFWAAFIPLLWHQKTKNAEEKPTNPKVVKEVPKTPPPATSGESSSPPAQTSATPPAAPPAQPTVSVPPAVPPQTADKVEPAKVAGSIPAKTTETAAGLTEDQAKPPIMPVPETKPATPSVGSTPVAQGVSGVVSSHKPGDVVQGVAAAKPGIPPGTGSSSLLKASDKTAIGAKSKPDAGSGAPEKAKPGSGSSTNSEVLTAKPTDSGALQPKITKQKAPVMIARPSGQPSAIITPIKPAASSAPAAAPSTTPPPPQDKPKESLQEANWVYIVHLGTFQNASQAQELQKKLRKKGYAAVVKSQQDLHKGKIYNVELTSIRDSAEARTKMNKLQTEEQLNPVLLKVMGKH